MIGCGAVDDVEDLRTSEAEVKNDFTGFVEVPLKFREVFFMLLRGTRGGSIVDDAGSQ